MTGSSAAKRGASPRERRNQVGIGGIECRSRRISARAEEPRDDHIQSTYTTAHLRASGGTHNRIRHIAHPIGASPRERRNQPLNSSRSASNRRISARAEEPRISISSLTSARAHLRASGGTAKPNRINHRRIGASPRERRNPLTTTQNEDERRRISARAEEPEATRVIGSA